MSDNGVKAGLELSVGGGALPVGAKLSLELTRRFSERSAEAIAPAIEVIGEDQLGELLHANEELDVLVVRAVTAAAESAYERKRALLGRIVTAASLDNAKIDESFLLIKTLEQIEAPHVRCLEEIYRTEQDPELAKELGPPASGAQKPLTSQVRAVVNRYPPPLIQALVSLGLLTGSVNWDGNTTIAGTTTFAVELRRDLRAAE